ncbi:uncharacterized protein TrAtP1_007702 [Trichoderma atroviride]|uniref:Uncharacterized protein n=1 Tax=Hypocrea atroviridis (strain ATCC 20476 / IMI 206040) TaxID=452589 RepID=G9NGV5_HYPAI|nr:uncharacterized protein TRIATDRAFT_289259 [Trichoderma atroviride IMI 206040]EHK49854.1 hypothetical protein TRIATDRAFT_289259 [Trichoderma atroviride IMI 206040]UKZ66528.1 hypothetical protein TrAtP1_007702 [Trichoderma atroviride]
MDSPGNNAGSGGDGANKTPDYKHMSRSEYMQKARAAIEERRQLAMTNRKQFEPQIHEQIQRLFQTYEAPFYAQLRGFGKAQTLALAESTVLSLAAVNNRAFEDQETQALTEHFLSSVHNLLAWKWAMTGFAGYMAYRGRKTWRFPFFNPEFKRFSPIGGSPGLKFMWHSARFAAYYGTLWVLGEPVFQGANFMRQRREMEADPRLRALLHDGGAQGATLLGGNPEAREQIRDEWESAAQYENTNQQYRDAESEQKAPAAPTQSAWTSYRSPATPSAQPQPQQQQSDAWDSSFTDDFDDASPVAPAARNRSDASNNSSGSAWDRIRQQAQYQPSQQNRKTWEKPQSGGGWGSEAESGAQYQGSAPRESYSFSSADEEKNLAKGQAQQEFDRLLEREREGQGQERSSWSRK